MRFAWELDIPRTGHSCNSKSRATLSIVKGRAIDACVLRAKINIIVPVATKPASTARKVAKVLSAGMMMLCLVYR